MSNAFQAKFVTKQNDTAIPSVPFQVNSSMTGKELNALVNAVLRENDDDFISIEFDFLIFDLLLRSSIDEHLKDYSATTGQLISPEKELVIEYVKKESTPEAFNSLLNDDWVACVQANEAIIINGCYDGIINIWTTDGQHMLSIPAHTSAVKDIHFVNKQKLNEVGTSFEECEFIFVSSSHDENCIFWKFNIDSKTVDCLSVFKGHERSVDCIDVYNDIFASGSFDNRIKIWSLLIENEETDVKSISRKKQKTSENENAEANQSRSKVRTPIVTIGGHLEAVTDVVWLSEQDNEGAVDLASCSMDNTIKLWDVELGKEKSNLTASKAFLAIDYSSLKRCLVTGSCDRHIRLWDPRSSEGSLVKAAFTNHQGWVSAVCWSTTNENLFLSGSYDNFVKLWDIRCHTAPLYDLIGHEEKVLAVDWSNPRFMISGSADNHLKIFESKS